MTTATQNDAMTLASLGYGEVVDEGDGSYTLLAPADFSTEDMPSSFAGCIVYEDDSTAHAVFYDDAAEFAAVSASVTYSVEGD